jgi:hypothetical protein
VREYQDRWQAVAKLEAAERRSTTMAERLREADRLVAFAREAQVDLSRRERDEEQARRGWAKLYEVLNPS